jgi:hypothetical protein
MTWHLYLCSPITGIVHEIFTTKQHSGTLLFGNSNFPFQLGLYTLFRSSNKLLPSRLGATLGRIKFCRCFSLLAKWSLSLFYIFIYLFFFSLFSEFSDLRKKWVNFPSSRHYQSLHQEHNRGKSSHCLLNQGKARFTFSVQKYFSWKKHLMRQWSCYNTLWIYGDGKCKVSSLCLNWFLKFLSGW